MLLSCVQTDVAFADITANLRSIEDWVDVVAAERADLAVFPECVLTGYGYESRAEAIEQAIEITDPIWATLTGLCGKIGSLHLVIGFLESDYSIAGTTRLFNASAVVGPSGIVASYRKVHLPLLGVDRWVDRGDRRYAVHDVGAARVGLAICYDCSFPEPMRRMGLDGADIIALPTNWPVAAARTAEIVPPARSMENHLYFVAANRIGTERGFRYCGLSSICGPDGVELARAKGDEPVALFAEVDLAKARNKRIERTPGAHVIDRFADRQPDYY